MAVQSFAGFLASMVGLIAFGAVLDAGLGWGAGFTVAGAGALLGVIALMALRRDPASAALAGGRR